MTLANNYLEKLQANQIFDLAEFVVTENFKHHSNNSLPKDYKNDVNSIHKEEMSYYENSEVYTAKDHLGSILGAIRVLKWNYTDVLPLQKIFNINPLLAINKPNINNIYHIGRFAIKKDVQGINLFKQLMVCAIAPICKHTGNIAFAECDSKLLRVLHMLGIKTTVIGESVNYLGSETIPIALTYEGLIDFYNENKALVSKDALKPQVASHRLPKRVVFNTKQKDYSLV